ncbi:IucA/IucC family siderophore biosynthesis protein [Zhongshania sp.]|uniref:IucA/IucC family protein n=1 Tax=Zhongshania sp. TaxID=1971902 RepID=UPI003569C1F8
MTTTTLLIEPLQQFEKIFSPPAAGVQQPFLQNLYRALAGHNAIGNLLNCYIREYAVEAKEVCLDAVVSDAPQVLQRNTSRSQLVHIDFKQSRTRLLIRADRVSLLGRCRFSSSPYLKVEGKPWTLVTAQDLCQFLLEHLAKNLNSDFNDELLEQVGNSIQATQAFLSRRKTRTPFADRFLRAEQSLLWGHAMHPAPKSRHGVAMDDMLSCSPEVFSSFPLYWFRVDPKIIDTLGDCDFLPIEMFSALHGKSEILYPCHPWEVYSIMRHPEIRDAIADGRISPIGFLGQKMAPTSSVRTLYHPDLSAQLKFSIHVRLTNCVRKNAWYELESAVVLSRLLKPIQSLARQTFPEFEMMPEPMATTLKLDSKECRESFGILYRENLSKSQREQYSPSLAASLFAWGGDGESVLVKKISKLSRDYSCGYNTMLERWFTSYVKCLLPGVLHYFFHHGVVFEPHLQNILIGFENGIPSKVWVRDLEGTKVLPEKWPTATFCELSARARQSIYYSRAQGWNRIAYCALINNLSEAIFHGAAGDPLVEEHLWRLLSKEIAQWQYQYGDEPELQALLNGAPIPSKNNFTTRLLKQADRASAYTFLRNPMVTM